MYFKYVHPSYMDHLLPEVTGKGRNIAIYSAIFTAWTETQAILNAVANELFLKSLIFIVSTFGWLLEKTCKCT